MHFPKNSTLVRAKELYHQLRLEEAYELFNQVFSQLSLEAAVQEVDSLSLYIRVLYELGKNEQLTVYRERVKSFLETEKVPELSYQVALSYLVEDQGNVEFAKKSLENLLFKTTDKNLLARIKMSLSTCYDILENDWKVCQSIIDSIDTEGLDPYLGDLVSIWKAKLLKDSGHFTEAELCLGKILSKVKSEYHWHAYLSAKIVLGGIYFKQERFDRLIDVIKEVKAYCDHYPLRTIKRQVEYLGDQIKGKKPATPLIWQRTATQSVLKYEDKILSLNGEKPWQKLLLYFIREKIVPKKEIIKKIYRREYRPKKDDKLIYGQLSLVKKNLLKLGLSEKTIAREPFGYRWIPEVSEVQEDSV